MKIVTFNLRNVWIGDGINGFIHRAGMIISKINTEKPDVICFQEGIAPICSFLEQTLGDYVFLFNQRNSDYNGEGLITAVRCKTVTVLGLDFFWLSDTPYVAGSRFEVQSTCPRICQVLILKNNESGKLFRVYNVHLDHKSDEARICGTKLIAQRIKADIEKLDIPYFFLGDFNATPDSDTIKYCNNNELVSIVDLARESGGTYHGYGVLENPIKIDYIFTDENTASACSALEVWRDCINGIYLSDHYPIAATVDSI